MKKIVSILLAISIFSAFTFANVTLAEDAAFIMLSADEFEQDNTVVVTAEISDNPGIAGYSLILKYDASLFELAEYSMNDYFLENGTLLDNSSDEGSLRLTWSDGTNFSDDGELFTVSFEAVDKIPDNYKFELEYDENNIVRDVTTYDSNGKVLEAKVENIALEVQNVIKGTAPTEEPAQTTPSASPSVDLQAAPTDDPLNVQISNPFTDVQSSDWYYQYVMYCLANKLFYGIEDYIFGPQTQMSRAMFVSVLYRLAGNDEKALKTDVFEDVKEKDWYGPAIYWAYEKGIINGQSATKFEPNALITREQMMVIIYNYYKGEEIEYNLNFSDASMISSWAKPAVRFCVSRGIVSGRENNTLAPTEGLTRAEAAKMFFTVKTTLNDVNQ